MSRPCPEDFGGERRPDGSIHWSDPDRADDFADAMACEDEVERAEYKCPACRDTGLGPYDGMRCPVCGPAGTAFRARMSGDPDRPNDGRE